MALYGAAARALILLYRRFIGFLKAGDYFSINNTGKTVSGLERNQIASVEGAGMSSENGVKMCRRV